MRSDKPLAVTYLRSEGVRPSDEDLISRVAQGFGATFTALDWSSLNSSVAPALSPGESALVVVGTATAVAAIGGPPEGASILALSDGREAPEDLLGSEDWLAGVVGFPLEEPQLHESMRRAVIHAGLLAEIRTLRRRVDDQRGELRELNRIGVALSAERDQEKLLEMILTKCRAITLADAGSLYLVERKEGAAHDEENYFADKELVFCLIQNDSVQVPFRESRMEVSPESIAGFVALKRQAVRIDDAYAIPSGVEYKFNRSFDESTGYRTRSLLAIPMKNHMDETIGVLQLINRKRDGTAKLGAGGAEEGAILPFDTRSEELASSLASQAAVAIENARLYEEIQNLFEGFIRASVTAIESRDPTTSGHSERVASFTVALAKKVDREDQGPLSGVRFSRDHIKEIQYASLLHDFGKIGVREHVLLKGKKLYPHELESILNRFRLVRRSLELKYARRKLELLSTATGKDAAEGAKVLDAELAARLDQLDKYLALIQEANEPTVLRKEASSMLEEVAALSIEGVEGERFSLLQETEALNLSIPKGSLSPEERLEIESHVTHTFEFLSNIPWTRDLSHVPRIAGAHHEKLDGSGYPRKISAQEIPVQSKIMTISDIFDALTARDRPYKKAIPATRALDILSYEVKEGKVDPELFRVFVEGKVYEAVSASRASS